MRNPSVSDELLEALYLRSGPFASIPDDRWYELIAISTENERLRRNEDDDYGPDMGHYRINKAIFRLLGIAPVEPAWLRTLDRLLWRLDFRHVVIPEQSRRHLDDVLARWAAMPDTPKDEEPFEACITNLGSKDEFRCLIAALYGQDFGRATASDIALRCAFYGNAKLTKKDMKAGSKRDWSAYRFAVVYNEHIYSRRELRKFFEDDQFGSSNLGYQYNLKLVEQEQGRLTDEDTRAEAIEDRLRLGELVEVIKIQTIKAYITSFFISVIWLICGYHLLTSS